MNDGKPHYVIDQTKRLAARFKAPVIACLGLAFKANIDDLRESPAIDIVNQLADEKVADIVVVEPNVSVLPDALRGKVELTSLASAIEAADIVLLLVDHREFKDINRRRLQSKLLVDTRGLFA